MNDQSLRRRLLREYLSEFAALVLGFSACFYLLGLSITSVFENGTITLNAGGRVGLVPVTLYMSDVPFAVLGALLLLIGFVGFVASLIARPAYHLMRLMLYRHRQLSRTPGSRFRRLVSTIHISVISVASVGLLCVVWQYVLIQLG